ncbi:ribonuclease Z [Gemella sp. GH3]|uniref:ribonuclease Z n=1 Tax=unclassified Gemella TaxID=2624949 RepID=UPI0015CFD761|nr:MULTISPECIES: ribonuclease Z [unclassified Gemella]MBF0714548.1 ribonuclease Z [Gemella sp. GH3.1]NYS51500.1 ribonuclease Z [Gemella sp. GH3]
MKVHFLGTGAGIPSKYRNTQSIVFNFMQELKECWMFDCGEGSQHKIMHTNIKPSKINRIFISHFHGDHILGLIGFLSSRSFLLNKEELPLTIYGPKGIEKFVEFNMKITNTKLNYPIYYVEYNDTTTIYENSVVKVDIISLNHTIQCFGFKVYFKNQKGTLLVDKLREIGIEPGPFYREVKNQETFIYNGVEYVSKDFLGDNKRGKCIAIIPDTSYFEKILDFVSDADVIISECTYLKEEEYELAQKYKHINILDIYNFVKLKNFDKIYLTHISSRYDKATIDNLSNNLPNNVFVVNDLDEYNI